MTPSELDVGCPHCKAVRGHHCVTPKGGRYYRLVRIANRRIKVAAAHLQRQKRARALNQIYASPNVRFRHKHAAVGVAERTPEGCEVLHLRYWHNEEACSS